MYDSNSSTYDRLSGDTNGLNIQSVSTAGVNQVATEDTLDNIDTAITNTTANFATSNATAGMVISAKKGNNFDPLSINTDDQLLVESHVPDKTVSAPAALFNSAGNGLNVINGATGSAVSVDNLKNIMLLISANGDLDLGVNYSIDGANFFEDDTVYQLRTATKAINLGTVPATHIQLRVIDTVGSSGVTDINAGFCGVE